MKFLAATVVVLIWIYAASSAVAHVVHYWPPLFAYTTALIMGGLNGYFLVPKIFIWIINWLEPKGNA